MRAQRRIGRLDSRGVQKHQEDRGAGDAEGPVLIEENEERFAIAWQGRFQFHGDMFLFDDNTSGRVTAISGYPVKQLVRVITEA